MQQTTKVMFAYYKARKHALDAKAAPPYIIWGLQPGHDQVLLHV